MTTELQLMTADELLTLPRGEFFYELVKGELIKMPPAGHYHGRISMNLAVRLDNFVRKNKLGAVYGADTGFKLESDPDTVLAPDVAFIAQQRVEAVGSTRGYWPGPPDLAVEVISHNDRASRVEEKVRQWLNFGTKEVWVVSPTLQTITVYRSATNVVTLTVKDKIEGRDLLSGFELALSEVFE